MTILILALTPHPTPPQLVALITDNPTNDSNGYRVFLHDLEAQEEADLISGSPVGYAREPQFTADDARLLLHERGMQLVHKFSNKASLARWCLFSAYSQEIEMDF